MKKFLFSLILIFLSFSFVKTATALGPNQFDCDWNPGTGECLVKLGNKCNPGNQPNSQVCTSKSDQTTFNSEPCLSTINTACISPNQPPGPDPTPPAYCVMGDRPGYTECTNYILPGAIIPHESQCTNVHPDVDDRPDGDHKICCKKIDAPTEIARPVCSVYQLRHPMCGSSDLVQRMNCGYNTEFLMCWGNNYRTKDQNLCFTDTAFPEPKEGPAPRTEYLKADGTTTKDPDEALNQFSSITYNGVPYGQIPKGRVCFCDPAVEGGCQCPGFEQEIGGEGESRLWFPHLKLIATLSTLAQSLFHPFQTTLVNQTTKSQKEPTLKNTAVVTGRIEKHQGVDDTTNVVNIEDNNSSMKVNQDLFPELAEYYLSQTDDPYNAAQCNVPVINNPGDDLLGPKIKTRVYYTNKFEYDALPTTNCALDNTVCTTTGQPCCSKKACDASPTTGIGVCPLADPVVLTAKGQVAPFVKSPLIEYIYDTIVSGSGSLFKKIMPDFASKKFDEIPSSVAYTASAESVNDMPGSTVKSLEGTTQFYVPHTGSLEKYWLEDIQKALRPQNVTGSGGNTTPTPPATTCVAPKPFSPEIQEIIDDAKASRNGIAIKTINMASIIKALHSIEGFSAYYVSGYSCQKNSATALGIMQITDSIMTSVTSASERPSASQEVGNCGPIEGKLNRCYAPDAVELAARVMLLKISEWNPTSPGEIVSKTEVMTAAYGYYGCYEPDQATVDRGNDNWGAGQGPVSDNQDCLTNYSEVICSRSGKCKTTDDYIWERNESSNKACADGYDPTKIRQGICINNSTR